MTCPGSAYIDLQLTSTIGKPVMHTSFCTTGHAPAARAAAAAKQDQCASLSQPHTTRVRVKQYIPSRLTTTATPSDWLPSLLVKSSTKHRRCAHVAPPHQPPAHTLHTISALRAALAAASPGTRGHKSPSLQPPPGRQAQPHSCNARRPARAVKGPLENASSLPRRRRTDRRQPPGARPVTPAAPAPPALARRPGRPRARPRAARAAA